MTNRGEAINSSITQAVAGLWAEVLQRAGPISDEANFFELGGDSLAVMILLFRIENDFGVKLGPEALVENPTLRDFCAQLQVLRTLTECRSPDMNAEQGDIEHEGGVL